MKVVHSLAGMGGVFRWDPNELGYLRVQYRRGPCQGCEFGVGDQHLGLSMSEDVSHLIRFKHEVNGHQNGTHPGQSKSHGRKTMGISRQHGHMVAAFYSDRHQTYRQSAHQCIKLGIAPFGLSTNDGGFVGESLSGASQNIAQSLAAGQRDGGG